MIELETVYLTCRYEGGEELSFVNEQRILKNTNLMHLYTLLKRLERKIDADGKDILHYVRKQLTKPLVAHGIISKEKAKDPFAA